MHSRLSKQTFLDVTSGGKFCFEITHNARVHVNFSLDFNTTLQSVDNISSDIFAATKKKYILRVMLIMKITQKPYVIYNC